MTLQQMADVLRYYSAVLPKGAPDFSRDEVVHFWLTEFGNMDIGDFRDVMQKLIRHSDWFPTVKQVHDSMGSGEVSDDAIAREVAQRIMHAVWKFPGLGAVRGEQRAREYVGELGEDVIDGAGGWRALIDSVTAENKGTREAQLRDVAKAKLEYRRAGKANTVPTYPELPQSKKSADQIKQLTDGLPRV